MTKINIVFCSLLASFFLLSNPLSAQESDAVEQNQATLTEHHWVDSVYAHLSRKERIGQLFMVAAYSRTKNNHAEIEKLLKAHQIGGLIFMQGTPAAQAKLTNRYQKMAQVPLLIGMDGEWGLGMRLTGVRNYPRQMLLGATRDTALVHQMGVEIAEQCKRMGVQVNFAPVVDVNNNPKNPVINFRSFGQDKHWVSKLGIAYMDGLQGNDIIACAKHFPGHGDVTVDSHKDLPVINKSREEIDSVELFPFRKMIHAGVKSIMVAHLDVPALDNTPHLPTTLSKKVVTGLLQHELGFRGLIFTDALNMKGVTKYYPNGETDLLAFLAGNDVLLFSQDVPLAIQKIDKAIESGKVSEQDLEQRVKKILRAKYETGLNHFQPIARKSINRDLNAHTDAFWKKAAKESMTLVQDNNNLVQKIRRPEAKIAYLNINVGDENTDFGKRLQAAFGNVSKVSAGADLTQYDVVLVGLHHLHLYPGSDGQFGLNSDQLKLINQLSQRKNVCFVVFGNAYMMKYLCRAGSVIVAYEDNKFTEQAAVNALKGKFVPQGILPVTSCPQ